MKKYLFLCNLNLNRSKYIEGYLKRLLKSQQKEGIIRSAGADPKCVNSVNQETLEWADYIFVLNEKPYALIKNRLEVDKKKIVNLDIPDIYAPETGKFSAGALENTLDYLTYNGEEQEAKRLSEKDEILNRLSLEEVLKTRNLEKYL